MQATTANHGAGMNGGRPAGEWWRWGWQRRQKPPYLTAAPRMPPTSPLRAGGGARRMQRPTTLTVRPGRGSRTPASCRANRMQFREQPLGSPRQASRAPVHATRWTPRTNPRGPYGITLVQPARVARSLSGCRWVASAPIAQATAAIGSISQLRRTDRQPYSNDAPPAKGPRMSSATPNRPQSAGSEGLARSDQVYYRRSERE